jgi:hypothetical protein
LKEVEEEEDGEEEDTQKRIHTRYFVATVLEQCFAN